MYKKKKDVQYIFCNDEIAVLCIPRRLRTIVSTSCPPRKPTFIHFRIGITETSGDLLTGFHFNGKCPGPWYMDDKKLYNVKPDSPIKMRVFKNPPILLGGHHIPLQCTVMPVTILIMPTDYNKRVNCLFGDEMRDTHLLQSEGPNGIFFQTVRNTWRKKLFINTHCLVMKMGLLWTCHELYNLN